MRLLKKVLLTIIYPFWLFFAKTVIGLALFTVIAVLIPTFIAALVFPNLSKTSTLFVMCIGILTFILIPYICMIFMRLGFYLEGNYKNLKYKTEL